MFIVGVTDDIEITHHPFTCLLSVVRNDMSASHLTNLLQVLNTQK